MKKTTNKIVSMIMIIMLFTVNFNLVLATTADEVTSELPLELTIEDQSFQDEYDQMVEDELNGGGRLRYIDVMLLTSQQWLNATYSGKTGYVAVPEDGKSRRSTVNGLIRALQIELGITATAPNFGTGTITRFNSQYPNGVVQQEYPSDYESNVYGIIQCALWTKGYYVGSGSITKHFYDGTGNAIKKLKEDMGIDNSDPTVKLDIMKGLLSMDYYVKLSGGSSKIRQIQQELNRTYPTYLGIIPCDGIYTRNMSKALIIALQAIEGYDEVQATGNFGAGTKKNLPLDLGPGSWVGKLDKYYNCIRLIQYCLCCNGYEEDIDLSSKNWSTALSGVVSQFQEDMNISTTGKMDEDTWMALLLSKGNPDRECKAIDTNKELNNDRITYLKSRGYTIVGRYISGLDKGLTRKEADRILEKGLSFFPIFQESGTYEGIDSFTLNRANQDAISASTAANNLGLPNNTIVYFAVDYDPTDAEIANYILPYFQKLSKDFDSRYKIGIYGTRNTCTKVMNAGYAITCFVSDMSTGYSGNMGFKMPNGWNLDQFATVSTTLNNETFSYDKVSYKGTFPVITSLIPESDINEMQAKYNVTEGEFVMGRDYLNHTGKAKQFNGRKIKLLVTITGEDGQPLNDGTKVNLKFNKIESNPDDPYCDPLPIVLFDLQADGTEYVTEDFSVYGRDYITISDAWQYYFKYDMTPGSTNQKIRIKVRIESLGY